jgi:hypothetical protein
MNTHAHYFLPTTNSDIKRWSIKDKLAQNSDTKRWPIKDNQVQSSDTER